MTLFREIDFYSRRRNIPHQYILSMPYFEWYYLYEAEYKLFEKEVDDSNSTNSEVEDVKQTMSNIESSISSTINDLKSN